VFNNSNNIIAVAAQLLFVHESYTDKFFQVAVNGDSSFIESFFYMYNFAIWMAKRSFN